MCVKGEKVNIVHINRINCAVVVYCSSMRKSDLRRSIKKYVKDFQGALSTR